MMGVVVSFEFFSCYKIILVSLVKVLVDAGADVNVKDEFSSSQRVAAKRKAHHSQGQCHVRDLMSCDLNICHVTYSCRFERQRVLFVDKPLHQLLWVHTVTLCHYS